MRVIPFILIAVLTAALSFLGLHPAYLFFLTVPLLYIAAILLALSYARWEELKTAVFPAAEFPPMTARQTGLIVCASIALTLSVLMTDWPLRLSYYMTKNSLNRIARQVRVGAKEPLPQSAGVFTIAQTHIAADLVCLWIDEDMGEPIGFVQGPTSKVKAYFSDYDVIVLDDEWCLVNSL